MVETSRLRDFVLFHVQACRQTRQKSLGTQSDEIVDCDTVGLGTTMIDDCVPLVTDTTLYLSILKRSSRLWMY
jgi:hypothetical protein